MQSAQETIRRVTMIPAVHESRSLLFSPGTEKAIKRATLLIAAAKQAGFGRLETAVIVDEAAEVIWRERDAIGLHDRRVYGVERPEYRFLERLSREIKRASKAIARSTLPREQMLLEFSAIEELASARAGA
jgi:hypothetical protein